MIDPKLEVQASALKREYLEKLRDEFAGKAMQGIIGSDGGGGSLRAWNMQALSAWAYEMADAMLKARG